MRIQIQETDKKPFKFNELKVGQAYKLISQWDNIILCKQKDNQVALFNLHTHTFRVEYAKFLSSKFLYGDFRPFYGNVVLQFQ